MTDASDPPWLVLARVELAKDTREVRGDGDNSNIAGYYATLGIPAAQVHDDTHPWCGIFAGAMLKRAGIQPPAHVAVARAYLDVGEACEPRIGALCVLERVDPKEPTVPHGHVAFLVAWTDTTVTLLGGNQGNRVSVHEYDRSRVLGLRWPA